MTKGFIIAGTDTNVGKTILSALLMSSIDEAVYWKPLQSGSLERSDSDVVREISGVDIARVLPEAYCFQRPLSPHLAAALDNVSIKRELLSLPQTEKFLIVECAGGVLVPIQDDLLQIDLYTSWALPVLLATRSSLGTINHTLLTLEALRRRGIEVFGCVVIGEPNPENEQAIASYGKIDVVGRIPQLPAIDRKILRTIYDVHFDLMKTRLTNLV